MEIVKELNLNKSPQDVPNGSLIFAKNVKLSEDGSYLTQEEPITSFIGKYELDISVLNGNIIGVIACSKDLIIFTDEDYIYRYSLDIVNDLYQRTGIFAPDSHNWRYEGGTLKGTYTYNVNKELIISVAESPANNGADIPLKTGKFSSNGTLSFYNINCELPICNLKLESIVSGYQIPTGIYHFFVRYELDNNQYSTWFPIGIPYYAINKTEKTLINNRYNLSDSPAGGIQPLTRVTRSINNTTLDAPYSFRFKMTFNSIKNNINKCQIGYILQKDDGMVGRLGGVYGVDSEINFIFSPSAETEIDINEFLENAFSIYNVKNITNYENRLYIANYKETEYNENLNDFISEHKPVINIYTVNYSDASAMQYEGGTVTGYRWIIGNTEINDNNLNPVPSESSYYMTTTKYASFITAINNNIEWKYWQGDDFATMPMYCVDSTQDQQTVEDNAPTGSECFIYKNLVGEGITFTNDHSNPGIALKRDGYYYFGVVYDVQTKEILSYLARIKLSYIKCVSIATNVNVKLELPYDTSIRTLMCEESYQFFIHYVRKDGSYTNGIFIGEAKCTYEPIYADQSTGMPNIKQYRVSFSNISIPTGFIGCFFSYDDVSPTVLYSGLNSGNISSNSYSNSSRVSVFKATEVETAKCTYNAKYAKELYRVNDDGTIAEAGTGQNINLLLTRIAASDSADNIIGSATPYADYDTLVNLTGSHGGIIVKGYSSNPTTLYPFERNDIFLFKSDAPDRFNKKVKNLVSLGGILYAEEGSNNLIYSEETTKSDFNYPAFICDDQALLYRVRIHVAEDGQVYMIDNFNQIHSEPIKAIDTTLDPTEHPEYDRNVYIVDRDPITGDSKFYNDYAYTIKYRKYSLVNLSAVSIKKEPEAIGGSYYNSSTGYKEELKVIGQIVRPVNATDLLQINSEYIVKHPKTFINYSTYNVVSNIKNGTIRRSQPIRDESTENSWRIFKPNQYKEIDKNKGDIVNIVGAGKVFIIHTEQTLFMLDKNSLLETENKNVQLVTPDTFSCDPQEVMTGIHGSGGLQFKNGWTINDYGYWWFDNNERKIYNFDNGRISEYSKDIVKFLDFKYKIRHVTFGTDIKNERILMCFCFADDVGWVTLSFSLYSKKFISAHDYFFHKAYNIGNDIFMLGNRTTYNSETYKYIYVFDNSGTVDVGSYSGLAVASTYLRYKGFPYSTVTKERNAIIGGVQRTYQSLIHAAYVDVIFNNNIETVKTLNSIHWIISKLSSYYNNEDDTMAEEHNDNYFNKYYDANINHFSGERIQIYTDSVNSGILDIYNTDKINKLNNYKYPYYDLGHWNLNYFRNMIGVAPTEAELNKIASNLGVPVSRIKDCLITVTDPQGNLVYRTSDIRSNIYGKYIVVRFIFNLDDTGDYAGYNKPVKLENVWVDYSRR